MMAPVLAKFKIIGGNNYLTGNSGFISLLVQCHYRYFSCVIIHPGGFGSFSFNKSLKDIFSSLTCDKPSVNYCGTEVALEAFI